MVRSNYQIPNAHFHKHWQRNGVRTWFNQPARKLRRLAARRERAAELFPRPTESLRPSVRCPTNRYNKRLRVGRGFTLDELKAAKFGVAFARTIGIAVDHRRKNKSVEAFQTNVQRLKAYKERVVLYPSHPDAKNEARRLKKGDVNDATAEALKTFKPTQSTEHQVVSVVQAPLREKAVKVTEDLKKRRVYRELRQEWSNQYNQGAKLKKAKEAAK
jgi:large subunit ribosomal protein L13e